MNCRTTNPRRSIFPGGAWLRSYGLTFHPNVLGGLLAVAVLLLSLWLGQKRAFAALVILASGLFLSFSRSAWVAAGILAPFVWFRLAQLDRKARKNLIAFLLAGSISAAILFVFFMPQVMTRLNPFAKISEYASLSGRGKCIRIALKRSDPTR